MFKKLTKQGIKNIAIFVIVLILYNIISFVIPFRHTSIFWGAYAFGLVAVLLQIGIVFLAAYGARTLRKKLYAFPVIKMGLLYLAVQLIVSLAFSIATTFADNIPTWIVYIVSTVVLGVFLVLILLTDTAKDEVIKIEEEHERKTEQVKIFRINIDSILRRAEDAQLLKILRKLSDIAKYSDPASCDALVAIESEITQKIGELDTLVRKKSIEEAKELAEQIIDLFEDRNAQCKFYKTK